MHTTTIGLLAGAAGTTALDAVSYLDMALRGRPASSTPQQSVQRLSELAGVDLGEGEEADNRRSGWGALLGYATGVGVGLLYATAVRRRTPWAIDAAALTVAAMVGSTAPMTLLGITDPRRWSATDWLSDLLPHLAYGTVAAAALRLPGAGCDGRAHAARGRG
ncbi:hypothetical protein ACQEU5_18930 [Marinactinospora thermotolerans]|uniref:Uncharacterized protein n=1 Tax=Marinactinospora thermotolerans DSM 45154 TaxID=1122192 RepID=A0A1T4NDI8_9ACTN|nr:hypothetical protein [Marinactinospora thermotolerans]SJZ77349.1 hypothetical protein SAMN02745673_01400 [Marinactinospora thermotolerans DSM 45154]